MTSSTFVLLSGVLSYGIPMALAVRELLMLSKGPRGGDEPPPEEPRPAPPRPLPACLLPPPAPVSAPPRVRVLEDA